MNRTFLNPLILLCLIVSVLLLSPILSSGIKHNYKYHILYPSAEKNSYLTDITSLSYNTIADNVSGLNTIPVESSVNADNESGNNPAAVIYETLKLDEAGMSPEVLEYAIKGYEKLLKEGAIEREGIISICDFSQSSRQKRLYVIDILNQKLLMNTYVAHGKNSGLEYAKSFSNKPESHQSSLGFYVTSSNYNGAHGLSLRVKGMEKGINDKAWDRAIVIHGADYVNPQFAKTKGYMGRSFGCPAVSFKDHKQLINTIKNGTCLFIYHPTDKYLNQSKIINS
ncbi:MAG TPA: murein L,D-transpeptidase catalytic domain family protein [Parasegetibacter sp.]